MPILKKPKLKPRGENTGPGSRGFLGRILRRKNRFGILPMDADGRRIGLLNGPDQFAQIQKDSQLVKDVRGRLKVRPGDRLFITPGIEIYSSERSFPFRNIFIKVSGPGEESKSSYFEIDKHTKLFKKRDKDNRDIFREMEKFIEEQITEGKIRLNTIEERNFEKYLQKKGEK